MTYYDNQSFLEISRTPQVVFEVSLFKASSTVQVSTALLRLHRLVSILTSEENIELDYDSHDIQTVIM